MHSCDGPMNLSSRRAYFHARGCGNPPLQHFYILFFCYQIQFDWNDPLPGAGRKLWLAFPYQRQVAIDSQVLIPLITSESCLMKKNLHLRFIKVIIEYCITSGACALLKYHKKEYKKEDYFRVQREGYF